MDQRPKWKITTHSPNPLRLEYDEPQLEGHRLGWYARRDLTKERKFIQYRAKCACKWKDSYANGEPVWVPKKTLIARYAKHLMECKNQGRLDV